MRCLQAGSRPVRSNYAAPSSAFGIDGTRTTSTTHDAKTKGHVMKTDSIALRCLLLATCAAPPYLSAQTLGTAFTYQGQLTEAGQAASGLFDLQACLFDSLVNPVAIGCAADANDVPVQAGVFTVSLDFGAAPFAGQQRFLELRVRPGASTGSYTALSPRQLVRPAPEALRANAASVAPWSGLTGVPGGFADGVDNTGSGTVTSVTAGTGLSGGVITGSGTLGIANGGVGTAQIAGGAVASAQIADGGVAAVDVAADSLTAAQIATAAIAAVELADSAVDTAAVQNLAITQAKIADSAIGPAQLAPGAVGLAQINTAQVQARITGTCAVGEYFRGINLNGSVACEPVPGVPRITTVDDSVNDVGDYPSIAMGADGLPVISYYDSTADTLKVAKCVNAACTGASLVSVVDDPVNIVGTHTSIAVASDGLPVISYRDVSANALKVAKCANAACTGSATISTVDDPTNFVGFDSNIAIGSDGLPVIAYRDTTARTVKVAKCSNAACTGAATITIVDDPANNVGTSASMAIGADGLPVISYRDDTAQSLKVAKCANPACTGSATITTVDDPANNVGAFTSIAIGTDQLPAISYRDTTDGAFRVAKCSDAACAAAATITVIVDLSNDYGFGTALAIGVDGLPAIAYLDSSNRSLKVAKCVNARCTGLTTISGIDDPANTVSSNMDMVIGSDGLPLIAYYDSTAGALKVAKCGTRSCQ